MFIFFMSSIPQSSPQSGQLLARGVIRHLREHDFTSLTEFTPAPGLRVDVMALGPKGQIWIVECKSSRGDFLSDHKWQGYLPWCDRFFWAVDLNFPTELLPEQGGLIIADAYGAEIIREAPDQRLHTARRRKLTLKMARNTADRLHQFTDPKPPLRF
jgi:hypothetical protein